MTPLPVLAADVGGTQMRAALVDHRGESAAAFGRDARARRRAGRPDRSHPHGRRRTQRTAPRRTRWSGLPGAVDYDAGRLLWAPHLPERWPDQLSDEELSTRLGLRAHIANDADLAAVGEAAFGAGAGIADVAYLTISTGIGAGVVHDGRLLRGRRSLAEVGHTVIDWRAWKEGSPSTLEELGSGSGLARMAREVGLGPLDAREVESAAAEGEPGRSPSGRAPSPPAPSGCPTWSCPSTRARSSSAVGSAGVRPSSARSATRCMRRPEHHPADLTIVRAALGDDAGLAGAAAWATATGQV